MMSAAVWAIPFAHVQTNFFELVTEMAPQASPFMTGSRSRKLRQGNGAPVF